MKKLVKNKVSGDSGNKNKIKCGKKEIMGKNIQKQ